MRRLAGVSGTGEVKIEGVCARGGGWKELRTNEKSVQSLHTFLRRQLLR